MGSVIVCGLVVFMIPFIGILSFLFVGEELYLVVAAIGVIASIASICICRSILYRGMKIPSLEVLELVEIKPSPVEYNPSKYKNGVFVCNVFMWFLPVAVVMAYMSNVGGDDLPFSVMIILMIGFTSFIFWYKFKQANIIYSEKDSRKREIYNGMIVHMEEKARKVSLHIALSKLSDR